MFEKLEFKILNLSRISDLEFRIFSHGGRGKDEDIVHAAWRHAGKHEQGIPSGSWGWKISLKNIISLIS